MILYDIKEEDSVLRDTADTKLSILIGMDSFSYVLQHPEKGLLRYRSYSLGDTGADPVQQLEKLLRGEVVLQKTFASTSICCHYPLFTVVPDRLYRKGEERTYLEHITDLSATDDVLVDELPTVKAQLAYVLPGKVHQLFFRYLPGARVRHLSSVFISHFSNRHFSGSGHHVYLHISRNQLYTLYFREEQFVFHNTFTFQSSTDCLYFVMLVFNQFGLDQRTTHVHLFGQFIVDSEIFRLLNKYLADIQLPDMPHPLTLAEHLGEYPPYFYFDHAVNLL